MKLAIIGTSGFIGKAILKEALERKYEVFSITKSKNNILFLDNPGLTTLSINIYDVENLIEVLKDVNVVISAFNAGWDNPNLYNDNIQGFQDIENACKLAEVDRFIMVGGAGTLFVNGEQLVDSDDFPLEIKSGAKACRDYFNVLKKEQYLNWTYFSPALELISTPSNGRTGTYRLGNDTPVFDKNGKSIISVEDAAVAILDEVEKKQFIKKQFTAAY